MINCQACICAECKHNIDKHYCEVDNERTCKGCESYKESCVDFENRLKPCPFCGGKPFIATIEHSEESRPNGYRFHGQIMCRSCQATCGTTGFDLAYEEATAKAIQAWNRRVN